MIANPYAPPSAQASAPFDRGELKRRVKRCGSWLAASVGLSIATPFGMFVFGGGGAARGVGVVGFGAAACCALLGCGYGLGALRQAWRVTRPSLALVLSGILALLGNFAMTAIGFVLAVLSTSNFSRGRQLRRFGRVLLPPLARGEPWATESERIFVDPAVRDRLAAQWRENGRTEHASVGAFAKVTLDLLALGAPPELIAAAQRDALDEIAHTETCFALARAIDGAVVGPGPFPAAARARPCRASARSLSPSSRSTRSSTVLSTKG